MFSRCLDADVPVCWCGESLTTFSGFHPAVVVLDLDADGDLDFVLSSWRDNTLEVVPWANAADGTWVTGAGATPTVSGALFVAHELARLFVVNQDTMQEYDADAGAFLGEHATGLIAEDDAAFTVGDFDGDGAVDLVRKVLGPADDDARVDLVFDVAGMPALDSWPTPAGPYYFLEPFVHACDLDGDAAAEIIDVDGGQIAFGAQAGVEPAWLTVPPLFGHYSCADIDGDGATDLLRTRASDTGTSPIFAMYNDAGTIAGPVELPLPPFGVDGVLFGGVAVARLGGELPALVAVGQIELFRHHSAFGVLEQARPRTFGAELGVTIDGVYEDLLAVIDTDGDGTDELLTATAVADAENSQLVLYRRLAP
jgi:hypothetical protein